MTTELDALITLTSIPHLGSIRIRLLIHHFGSASEALAADEKEIALLPDFGNKVSQGWNTWKKNTMWQQNLELAARLGVEIIPYTSPMYPKRLLDLPDHPVILYVKGKILPEDQQSIAVIGTRQASIYGLDVADKISNDLATASFTIVSGLARGIDTAAHVGALRRGRTIAVIGSGLADIYPRENYALAEAISQRGALISEFPMATPPDRQNFPQRNRIVSGMTLGTLLVEAPVKSGAMITVERALAYKRKVFAVPGRVDGNSFQGNHYLIKTRQAELVENAQDVVNCFDDLFSRSGTQMPIKPRAIPLSEEETNFLATLPNHEISVDEMVQITHLPVMRINILLMSLLLKKMIREFPGRIYKKVSNNG